MNFPVMGSLPLKKDTKDISDDKDNSIETLCLSLLSLLSLESLAIFPDSNKIKLIKPQIISTIKKKHNFTDNSER